MPALLLTPRAKADLDDIWKFSVAPWGEDRTEHYIRELWRGIERQAEDTRRGRPCDDIRPGYLKYAVGSHVVFARLAEDTLVVVRILHQRMDFDRHLSRALRYRQRPVALMPGPNPRPWPSGAI